jgi:hypothetical protein
MTSRGATMDRLDPMAGPPAPELRVPLRDRMRCLSQFGKGFIRLSEAGGSPVAVARLGPKGIAPEFAMVTSPLKAHDVSGAADGPSNKAGLRYDQFRQWLGGEPCGFRHEDTTFPLPMVSAGPVPMKVGAR